MEKQTKVIDASVVVKWFLKEDNSDKARSLKESHLNENILLRIPEFLFLEVLNAIRYKSKDKDILDRVKRDLFDIQLKIEPLTELLLNRAIEISLEHDLTIYDSIYVSIAQIYGIELISADRELYKIPKVVALDKI